MWAAGMSEKSKVTRNIFTTVWLGLNKVWEQDSPGQYSLWIDFPLFPHQLPLGTIPPLTTWMVPTLGTL